MRPVLGVSLKILSALLLTCMIALIKVVSERIPVGEVVFARAFFGIFPVLAMVAVQGDLPGALRTKRPIAHAIRSLIGITGMLTWFAALSLIPLPDATAISFSAPLFTVVFAAIFLGETVRAYRWGAVVAGFVGVLVILSPNIGAHAAGGSDNLQTGAILAFVAALCMGAAMTMVRMLTGTERTAAIVIYMAIVGTVFSLATLPFGWVVPSATDAALLVLIGLVGGVGQILMTQSYRYADASTIAPFDYTSMIWALLIGWLAFGEVPGIPVYVGSAILVSAGLFVIYREHRLGLDRTQARRASMPTRV